MNKLSVSLFQSPYEVPRDGLRDRIGEAVSILYANTDNNPILQRGGTIGRIGACAAALFDVLDDMDREEEIRRSAPGFDHDLPDLVDLRALPRRLNAHENSIDTAENTDAAQLIQTFNELAMTDPAERQTKITAIAGDAMPWHDSLDG